MILGDVGVIGSAIIIGLSTIGGGVGALAGYKAAKKAETDATINNYKEANASLKALTGELHRQITEQRDIIARKDLQISKLELTIHHMTETFSEERERWLEIVKAAERIVEGHAQDADDRRTVAIGS